MMIERVMLIPKMFFFQGNHFSQPFSEPAGGGGSLLSSYFPLKNEKAEKARMKKAEGKKTGLKYSIYVIISVKKISRS